MPVYDVYLYELNVFMYKYYRDDLPVVFQNYFLANNYFHRYATRNSCMLRVPLFTTRLGQSSFYYNAVVSWNNYGYEIVKNDIHVKIGAFKSKVKCVLLKNV